MPLADIMATRLFEKFTGEKANNNNVANVTLSDIVLTVGKLDSIIYTTVRDGKEETYHHQFDDRPVLAVSHDGNQIYILAGEYEFTEKGFI